MRTTYNAVEDKWVKIRLIKLLSTYVVYWTWFFFGFVQFYYVVFFFPCCTVKRNKRCVTNEWNKSQKNLLSFLRFLWVCVECGESVKQLEKLFGSIEVLAMTIQCCWFFFCCCHCRRWRWNSCFFVWMMAEACDFIL